MSAFANQGMDPGASAKRKTMTRLSPNAHRGIEAAISPDGGATWSEAIRVLDWNGLDGGYPSTVQRADGQVVTAYYASALPGDPWDSQKNYHLGVVVWDVERSFRKH
jgi:hypothetical protein